MTDRAHTGLTPGEALIAALGDFYRQSWRLLILNAAFSAVVVPLLVASIWTPLLLVVAFLIAGPLALALMHCAVTLAQTEELSLRCGPHGLRLHWRRGIALGALCGLVALLSVFALVTYGGAELWVLVAVVLYLLVAFGMFLIALLPLAVADRRASVRSLVRRAGGAILRRPLQAFALWVALAIVNLAGAAAAVLPLLTLTIAYSFLAAAHFALPRGSIVEAHS